MKKMFFSLLAATLLVSMRSDAQVDDIVQKHLDAIGGVNALMKVSSLKEEGNLNAQGFDIPFTRTVIQGKGLRQVINVAGTEGFFLARPDSGWNYMPFMGQTEPVVMEPNELKDWTDEFDPVDNFVDYKAKGITAAAVSPETIDGKSCPGITLTFKNGYAKTFYFDPGTWYIIRSVGKKTSQGSESDVQTDYSKFEKLPEGIVVPKMMVAGTVTYTIEKVVVNTPADAAVLLPAVK